MEDKKSIPSKEIEVMPDAYALLAADSWVPTKNVLIAKHTLLKE